MVRTGRLPIKVSTKAIILTHTLGVHTVRTVRLRTTSRDSTNSAIDAYTPGSSRLFKQIAQTCGLCEHDDRIGVKV